MSRPGRVLRAVPALLRVGLAETVAYRAEFLVWILAYTMPLVMLALWTAVAREAPVGRFGQTRFAAYFLATLVVRVITSSWVSYQLTMEIRQGQLAMRLLRPVHPLLAYACEHVAAVPLRLLVTLPLAVAALVALGGGVFAHDPVQWLLAPLFLAGAWAISFLVMIALGSLSFHSESALATTDLWMALYFVFSGYLMPLEFLPRWLLGTVRWLPFRYQLAAPVEDLLGLTTRAGALRDLAVQWAWVLVLALVVRALWRSGLRRFSAYGG